MDSKELAAVRNWTRGVTPQELLEHIDILEGCISILQQENARLKATHEAELGVCESECEVVVELKAGVQRWTEEAARYCKNADYWRDRAIRSEHRGLDLQYSLDDTTKENKRMRQMLRSWAIWGENHTNQFGSGEEDDRGWDDEEEERYNTLPTRVAMLEAKNKQLWAVVEAAKALIVDPDWVQCLTINPNARDRLDRPNEDYPVTCEICGEMTCAGKILVDALAALEVGE